MDLPITRSDYDTLYTCTEMSHCAPEACTITMCCEVVLKPPHRPVLEFSPQSHGTAWEPVTFYKLT